MYNMGNPVLVGQKTYQNMNTEYSNGLQSNFLIKFIVYILTFFNIQDLKMSKEWQRQMRAAVGEDLF